MTTKDETKKTAPEVCKLSAPIHYLQKCASKDNYRGNISGVYFSKKGKYAVATNGHILAARRIGRDEILPKDLLANFKKLPAKNKHGLINYRKIDVEPAKVGESDGLLISADSIAVTTSAAPFPSIDQVTKPHKKPFQISIDAKYLATVAEALGANLVTIEIDTAVCRGEAPIFVACANCWEAQSFGVIMPAKRDEEVDFTQLINSVLAES